jgi:protein-tyrosine phosphatase
LEQRIEIDSAGTGAWHVGSSPDERASAAAKGRGFTLQGKARQVRPSDLEEFDLLLAMDRSNLSDLRDLATDQQTRGKVRLLREFDPASAQAEDLDVPDPYYGASGGFEEVLDLVQAACAGLLERIRTGALV